MQEGWFRKRWYEFRLGHSTYLIFMLTFVNFILIAYRLLIERIPFLQGIVPELWIFAILFIGIYFPVAILVGLWHRKTQLKIETTLTAYESPVLAKMFRTMLDVKTGKASEKEIEEFREFLLNIERKFKV